MNELFFALGLVFILEGLGPLLFPNKWRAIVIRIAKEPPDQLRQFGALLVFVGLVIVFFLSD